MTGHGARLRFWGVRGSCPAPGAETVRHGGHTPCLSLEAGDGELLVLDAGSGMFPLGRWMSTRDPGRAPAALILSHAHWDHILGLPFFEPLYHPGDTLQVFGPRPHTGPLTALLERLFDPAVFPVPRARDLEVVEVDTAPWTPGGGGWTVRGFRAAHPGTALGYRVEAPGLLPLAYFPDNELGAASPPTPSWRQDLVHFLSGVHTLIHDAMFTADELASRRGWGHSAIEEVVELAREVGCTRLVLFHHAPERSDDEVDGLLERARELAGSQVQVVAAMEGERGALPLEKEA